MSPSSSSLLQNAQYLFVLPVLLLEFLALSITRAVIPTLLLQTFADNVYFVMGCAECIRGLLAFVSCPAFGKISDVLGRKSCLFVTVLGTCSPVCSLAVMSLQNRDLDSAQQSQRIWIFVILLSISGLFSSTFTLTFAYISDTVENKKDRVTAYGLALATFGLSFTIGPMAGGYLAHVQDESGSSNDVMAVDGGHVLHPIGQRRVFCTAMILALLDLLYIYFILPESVSLRSDGVMPSPSSWSPCRKTHDQEDDHDLVSVTTFDTRASLTEQWNYIKDVIPNAWSPLDTLKIFSGDPFMYEVGCISFLYYTALWAVVSTLTLYAAKRFQMGPERLGELMSALGLSTMLSEAVLVRIVVPAIGEKRSMRLGLAAFSLQCAVLAIAFEGWQLFICVLLSTASNLVYPSLTSLVSSAVAPEMVGEALGAVNGVKAMTEGVGPLIFGTLMTFSEKTSLPGWPYLLASLFAIAAYRRGAHLPDENDEEYISERFAMPTDQKWSIGKGTGQRAGESGRRNESMSQLSEIELQQSSRIDEYRSLLSEIEQLNDPHTITSKEIQDDTAK
jgi:Major Facilitator Superfamily.